MSTSAFLDKYFECIDSMPQDIQRYVTQLREIEIEKRALFEETERLRGEMMVAVEKGSRKQMVLFRQLQECLLKVREVGNTKLDVSAQMLDTVEEYTQQLGIRAKELETNPRGEDLLYHTPRYNNSQYPSYKGDSPSVNNGLPEVKVSSSKRNSSSSKRPRQPATTGGEKASQEEDPPLLNNGGGSGAGGKDSGGGASRVKEAVGGVSTLVVSSGGAQTGGPNNGKPPKKKVKTVKKSSKTAVTKERETPPSAPPPAHVPMPDLTSQPLDPNEPTYCLCQQVSFGEMIGCDNDNCQIEWFHFQCVGLVSKPKGKWYCPQCAQERKAKSGK